MTKYSESMVTVTVKNSLKYAVNTCLTHTQKKKKFLHLKNTKEPQLPWKCSVIAEEGSIVGSFFISCFTSSSLNFQYI